MRPRTAALSLLLLIPLVTAATTASPPRDTYPRQPGIDAEHYVFQITLADDSDRIFGETEVHFRFRMEGVTELFLDLASVSPGNDGKGMTVSGVTAQGAPVQWTHEADRLRDQPR